ncbi:hypothetical protein CBR_g7943 [Chara braunii]|uniref:Integrase catalytic domain-containing protein n=1 Tax=Chara braunii TaxID=69332 RepID=A0A388KKR6_CHABU|nr:hypothetical protein CBR_g7943 [Chara braunii]|eukprot:GBG70641.1 hypothetical protein CBR_g7943 [Chara braunii]
MQRKYRRGDGLLTTTILEDMNKEDFTTIGAFVQEFKKRARKVHGISEEAQCAIFLGLLTASETVELTRHGGGSTKLTWATIDRGVEVGCLDQVEQRQVRLQRQKRKERDATASGTPGVTRIVTDVLAQLGYATEPVVQRRVVTAVRVKEKEPVIEKAGQEELWEEEEPVSQHLTKVQRKEGEAVENMPPVDGFLDQEEDVRLHINKWSPRLPSCVGYPIWEAPKGYGRRNELVLRPFEEEDPWGGNVDEVPESQDDEFEEGEIKEAFCAEEYDGIYLELGFLLSCEMGLRDASDMAQRMLWRYLVRDDHLFVRREVGNPRRVICGRNRQIDVVASLHDGIAGGHRGVQATYAKISELYYWDEMMDMVKKFCRSCVPCQERSRLRQGEPLHPRLEREVGAVVYFDLLFMPLGDQGYNYIFDARDNMSGFVDGRAIRTKTGLVLVSCIEEYYLRYPFVREFVMDRGSEFTCQEVQELLSRYGIAANYTTTAHPQANAPVERGHSTITSLLAKWTEGRPNQWPRYLRTTFFVENITIKRSTKHAPATLWYGRHATFPVESFLKTWRRQDLEVNLSFEELLDIRARQIGAIKERIQEASDQVTKSRMDDKARWDQSARVRKVPLSVGDVVLLYDSSLEKQWSRKLDKRWLGPYRIVRVEDFGAYQIEELNETEWKDWVSGTRLKKFVAREERSEAAGALPGQSPSAPAKAPEIPEMWRDFWKQRGEELPSPVRAGFGVARKAEERLDRKIKFLAKTTFERHLLLEGDLTGKKMKEASHGVRLEAMEVEIQELRAMVASQAAIIESLRQQAQGRVDRPESSRQGELRQPGQGLPGQPSAAEPRQEPPMGRAILEPEEARAQRQAEREAFEFRAPTELATLLVAAAGPVVPLAVEEGLPPSSSEPAQGLAEGSMGVLLEAVHTMQEEVSLFSPEQRIEEPLEREIGIEAESAIGSRLQRMGTP